MAGSRPSPIHVTQPECGDVVFPTERTPAATRRWPPHPPGGFSWASLAGPGVTPSSRAGGGARVTPSPGARVGGGGAGCGAAPGPGMAAAAVAAAPGRAGGARRAP